MANCAYAFVFIFFGQNLEYTYYVPTDAPPIVSTSFLTNVVTTFAQFLGLTTEAARTTSKRRFCEIQPVLTKSDPTIQSGALQEIIHVSQE